LKIDTYRQKRQELDRLKSEIETMEKSDLVKKEISFVNEINKVLKKYNRTAADLAMVFPESETTAKAKPATSGAKAKAKVKAKVKAVTKKKRLRKSPPVRTFKHPKTGETVKVKRTNNKTLKSWASSLGVSVDSLEVK